MSHIGQEIIKCSCGKVLFECQCAVADKKVIVRERACDACSLTRHGGGGTGAGYSKAAAQ